MNGYKPKRPILSFDKLKEAMKDPLIGAIIKQRVEYVDRIWDMYEQMFGKTKIVAKGLPDTSVRAAFNKARETQTAIVVESTTFALLGCMSRDGKTSGPYIITVFMHSAVEIGENGRFKDVFPASQEGYFPWTEEEKK